MGLRAAFGVLRTGMFAVATPATRFRPSRRCVMLKESSGCFGCLPPRLSQLQSSPQQIGPALLKGPAQCDSSIHQRLEISLNLSRSGQHPFNGTGQFLLYRSGQNTFDGTGQFGYGRFFEKWCASWDLVLVRVVRHEQSTRRGGYLRYFEK